MFRNYNSLTRLASFACLLLMVLVAVSCKKDALDKSKLTVEEAKSWYLQSKKNLDHTTEAEIKSTISAMRVKPEPMWNSSQSYQLSDGTEIVGVPLKINTPKGMKAKGNYFLLISKTDGVLKRTVVTDQKEAISNESISSMNAIEKLYKGSVNLNLSHNITSAANRGGNKIMNYQEQTCTDWYYTETTYDEYGNIIDYYEMYLWTDCTDGGGGSTGGGGPSTQTFDWGEPTDKDLDEQVTEDESEEAGVRYFTRRYRWTFHESYLQLFVCKSYEKGRTKEVPGSTQYEKFISFQHLSAWPVGTPIAHEVEIIMLDASTMFSDYTAKVDLWYKIHRKGTGGSVTQPAYSPDKTKSKIFNVGDYAIN